MFPQTHIHTLNIHTYLHAVPALCATFSYVLHTPNSQTYIHACQVFQVSMLYIYIYMPVPHPRTQTSVPPPSTHTSDRRLISDVCLFRHEHSAAARGVTLKSREGVRGRAQRLPRGASEASPCARRRLCNVCLVISYYPGPLPRMMQLPPRSPSPLRDGLMRPAHTSNTHASYARRHTYLSLFLAMYVSPHIHTHV